MKKIILLSLLLTGCSSPQYVSYISDKDAWVAIRSSGNDIVFYCERMTIKNDLLPVCTQAVQLSDEFTRVKLMQQRSGK